MPENKEDATIQVIAERISSLHGDVTDLRNDMRESYKEMSEAIKSLIRLEKEQPETKRIVGLAYKALWMAAAAAISFIAKAVGLI